jgi:hypothetical protein
VPPQTLFLLLDKSPSEKKIPSSSIDTMQQQQPPHQQPGLFIMGNNSDRSTNGTTGLDALLTAASLPARKSEPQQQTPSQQLTQSGQHASVPNGSNVSPFPMPMFEQVLSNQNGPVRYVTATMDGSGGASTAPVFQLAPAAPTYYRIIDQSGQTVLATNSSNGGHPQAMSFNGMQLIPQQQLQQQIPQPQQQQQQQPQHQFQQPQQQQFQQQQFLFQQQQNQRQHHPIQPPPAPPNFCNQQPVYQGTKSAQNNMSEQAKAQLAGAPGMSKFQQQVNSNAQFMQAQAQKDTRGGPAATNAAAGTGATTQPLSPFATIQQQPSVVMSFPNASGTANAPPPSNGTADGPIGGWRPQLAPVMQVTQRSQHQYAGGQPQIISLPQHLGLPPGQYILVSQQPGLSSVSTGTPSLPTPIPSALMTNMLPRPQVSLSQTAVLPHQPPPLISSGQGATAVANQRFMAAVSALTPPVMDTAAPGGQAASRTNGQNEGRPTMDDAHTVDSDRQPPSFRAQVAQVLCELVNKQREDRASDIALTASGQPNAGVGSPNENLASTDLDQYHGLAGASIGQLPGASLAAHMRTGFQSEISRRSRRQERCDNEFKVPREANGGDSKFYRTLRDLNDEARTQVVVASIAAAGLASASVAPPKVSSFPLCFNEISIAGLCHWAAGSQKRLGPSNVDQARSRIVSDSSIRDSVLSVDANYRKCSVCGFWGGHYEIECPELQSHAQGKTDLVKDAAIRTSSATDGIPPMLAKPDRFQQAEASGRQGLPNSAAHALHLTSASLNHSQKRPNDSANMPPSKIAKRSTQFPVRGNTTTQLPHPLSNASATTGSAPTDDAALDQPQSVAEVATVNEAPQNEQTMVLVGDESHTSDRVRADLLIPQAVATSADPGCLATALVTRPKVEGTEKIAFSSVDDVLQNIGRGQSDYPLNYDVYDGQGEMVKRANLHFRTLTRQVHMVFKCAKTHSMKRQIAEAVYLEIVSKGGKFLNADSSVKDRPSAVRKIMKSLKDCKSVLSADRRKQSSQPGSVDGSEGGNSPHEAHLEGIKLQPSSVTQEHGLRSWY